jgi:hypothetical protein
LGLASPFSIAANAIPAAATPPNNERRVLTIPKNRSMAFAFIVAPSSRVLTLTPA